MDQTITLLEEADRHLTEAEHALKKITDRGDADEIDLSKVAQTLERAQVLDRTIKRRALPLMVALGKTVACMRYKNVHFDGEEINCASPFRYGRYTYAPETSIYDRPYFELVDVLREKGVLWKFCRAALRLIEEELGRISSGIHAEDVANYDAMIVELRKLLTSAES